MVQHSVEADLKEAFAAVRHAQDTRGFHGRRTQKGSKQREDDLKAARARLKLAMIPLRSYLARTPRDEQPPDLVARIAEASQALQRERRKIWKMQQRKPRRKKK